MTRQGNSTFVQWNRNELGEHLPRPGRKWAWHESSLPEELRQKLLDRDCIEQDDTTGLWETKQSFFDLVERLTSGNDIGETVGQEPLIDARGISSEKSSRALVPRRPRVKSKQITFDGGEATFDDDVDDMESVRQCREAGKLGDPEVREKRRRERDAGQASLHGVTWSDTWDVTDRDGVSLTAPTGNVYETETQRICDAASDRSPAVPPPHLRN